MSETIAGGRCRRRVAHTASPILQSTHQLTDDRTVFGCYATPLDPHTVGELVHSASEATLELDQVLADSRAQALRHRSCC